MKLPAGSEAVVDLEKLTGYCLNPDHPRGKHKARLFAAVLGFSAEHAGQLREACWLPPQRLTRSPRRPIDSAIATWHSLKSQDRRGQD